MKNQYFVIVEQDENGKQWAHALTIRTNNNILAIIARYNKPAILQGCETATAAHNLAVEWNRAYKENGTAKYDF